MEKLTKQDRESLDMVAKNLEALQGIFPEAFSEDGVDFEVLRELLGDTVADGEEKYGLTWHGKRNAGRIALTPSLGTLRPCREESVDWDRTQNLFIEGDNLEVLKLLQKSYANTVKMIYIDPPYNTGKEFIYPDRFQDNLDTYLKYTGQKDDEGFKISSNTESSGRYHTNWLNMMFPRLKLARGLLKDDGVIFISIDDNEMHHLRTIMDDIFGEENYLVTLYGQVRYPGKTLAEKNNYQKLIEQTFVYQKGFHNPIKTSEAYSLEKFCWNIIEKDSGQKIWLGGREVTIFRQGEYEIKKVTASIDALKETWATGAVLKTSGRYFGAHLAPRKTEDGLGVLYKVEGIGEDGLGYRYFTGPKRETATKGKLYSGVPTVRRNQIKSGLALKYKPIINFKDFSNSFGNCRHEGEVDFRGGKKPIAFIKFLLNQAIEKDGIVLDFFSGSGSVAHAVMNKNLEYSSSISYIMVQLPELVDPIESGNDEFANIAELGKERIRRAAAKIKKKTRLIREILGSRYSSWTAAISAPGIQTQMIWSRPLLTTLNIWTKAGAKKISCMNYCSDGALT